jgi:hypothetical protein
MRRRDHYWSLYHLDESKQLDELRTDQVEAVFSAIPVKDQGRWLIWKDGLVSWKPFSEFPDLVRELRKVASEATISRAPAAPDKTGEEIERERDRTVVKELKELETPFELEARRAPGRGSTPSRGSSSGRRDRSRRYMGRFKVEVASPLGRFKTVTLNASLSGMHLKDPLPSWVPRYFNLIVHGPKEGKITLLCSAIRERSGAPPLRIKIESNDHVNVLRTWLLEI